MLLFSDMYAIWLSSAWGVLDLLGLAEQSGSIDLDQRQSSTGNEFPA
jgi:hypothetical protein